MLPYHPTALAIQQALEKIAADGSWRTYEGPHLVSLRANLARSFRREHVRLCCSGTFGIELAIRSLKLEEDAEVLLAGYDYPGNFRAIEAAGARVALCDVALESWVPNIDALDAALGPKTRAIVISHLHGSLAPMESICRWARDKSLFVVEDACQEPGAIIISLAGETLAGSWGDISVLSFGGSKLLSAGRGGAVLTNDSRLAQRMTIYCERGNDSYALSELQAAILIPQSEQLQHDNALRRATANRLRKELLQFTWIHSGLDTSDCLPGYYKYGLRVSPTILESTKVQQFVSASKDENASALAIARRFVLKHLERGSIAVGAGFLGFANRSKNRCRSVGSLENSIAAADGTLVLHHSHLVDPMTGASTIESVLVAFHELNQELAH
jgi:dTDP-4-amino-4,6-dideoxygalactose transaminase